AREHAGRERRAGGDEREDDRGDGDSLQHATPPGGFGHVYALAGTSDWLLSRLEAMDAIVADDLRKRYKAVQALDGVSFAVREGEVFGLLGPNGAGKSTTVRVLTTLTRPDSGRAFVAGEEVAA